MVFYLVYPGSIFLCKFYDILYSGVNCDANVFFPSFSNKNRQYYRCRKKDSDENWCGYFTLKKVPCEFFQVLDKKECQFLCTGKQLQVTNTYRNMYIDLKYVPVLAYMYMKSEMHMDKSKAFIVFNYVSQGKLCICIYF